MGWYRMYAVMNMDMVFTANDTQGPAIGYHIIGGQLRLGMGAG